MKPFIRVYGFHRTLGFYNSLKCAAKNTSKFYSNNHMVTIRIVISIYQKYKFWFKYYIFCYKKIYLRFSRRMNKEGCVIRKLI